MAQVVVTLKIMPENPEVDLDKVQAEALEKIKAFAGPGDTKTEQIPMAFGLKSLQIIFIMDEAQGSTEPLEEDLSKIKGVNSVEVTDVRRAVG